MRNAIVLGAVGCLVLLGCGKDEGPNKEPNKAGEQPAESQKPVDRPTDPPTTADRGDQPAKAPANPKSDPCRPFHEDGVRLFTEKKLDQAAAMFAKGYQQCGPGYGFLGKQGFVLSEQGKTEEAAALFLREVSEPGPQPEAFGNLERIRDKLSDQTKARIVGMGATADSPVHVIGVDGEYSWARAFTCMGARKLGKQKQNLAKGAQGQMLDQLTFECPDGAEHSVFFDYGVDPQEAQYLRERQQIEQANKQPKP